METPQNWSTSNIPPLPEGCPELQQTPGLDDQPLEQHFDALPALDRQQIEWLQVVAVSAEPNNRSASLRLTDLLRRRRDGSHALHPRVIQVLSVAEVDPTLTRLSDCVDKRIDYSAYQYPQYIIETGPASGDERRLCPEEYSIDVIDVVRDLRANAILTSIRLPGESACGRSARVEEVKRLEKENYTVEGVITLQWPDTGEPSGRPALVIDDTEPMLGRRSPEELVDLCETLCRRFNALLSITMATNCE